MKVWLQLKHSLLSYKWLHFCGHFEHVNNVNKVAWLKMQHCCTSLTYSEMVNFHKEMSPGCPKHVFCQIQDDSHTM